MATIIWLTTSGGVITADIINTITNAYFLVFIKKSGVTTPILVKKYMMIGNSKIKPEANTDDFNKEMYELIVIFLDTSSLTE